MENVPDINMQNFLNSSSVGGLQQRVNQWTIRLENEINNHNSTYILYTNALQLAKSWEDAHTQALAELDVAYITVTTYKAELERLRMENQRLNCVINHLVPARTIVPPNNLVSENPSQGSDIDQEAHGSNEVVEESLADEGEAEC